MSLRERVTAWEESDETHGALSLLIRFSEPVGETETAAVREAGATVADRLGPQTLRVTDTEGAVDRLEGLDGVEHVEVEATGCQQADESGNSDSPTGTTR